MEQNLKTNKQINYPYTDYLKRFIWSIVNLIIWPILWHKIPYLRMILLKCFGAKVFKRNLIYGSVKILRPWDFEMGEYSAIGSRVHVYNLGKISIGKNTVISQDVYLCGGTHDHQNPSLPLLKENIVIGDNIWICAGAFIAPGVTIGDGAIIGARSNVLTDVEPYTIVAGNPAKFIKKRIINV